MSEKNKTYLCVLVLFCFFGYHIKQRTSKILQIAGNVELCQKGPEVRVAFANKEAIVKWTGTSWETVSEFCK